MRAAVVPSGLMRRIESIGLSQGKILTALNRCNPVQPFANNEFSIFSQWGEDGIIQRLVESIDVAHRTFIEFGVEDFGESNCRFLMMNNNWRGFVVDGSAPSIAELKRADWYWKFEIEAQCAMITRDNINDILIRSGFDHDLGVLSIDVDGIDFWLLEAINTFQPRILIVEYNSLFGGQRAISVPYDDGFARRKAHFSELYFGASLRAFEVLAGRKGYSLVGTTSVGLNAFFVRNDLLSDDLQPKTSGELFRHSAFRQSRDEHGRLNFLNLSQQLESIRGLPVVNVETGSREAL